MNSNEFLRILRESLEMSLEQDAINAQLDYYDKYISDEIKNGKTEKEVLEELGDPRLIAKTIKTVNTGEGIKKTSSDDNDYNNDEYRSQGESYNSRRANSGNGGFRTYYSSNNVIGCAIAFLVFFIIVYGILRFFGNVAYGIGSFAFSGPIGFLIVFGLLYLFFGGGRK